MPRPAPKFTINLVEGSVAISNFSVEATQNLKDHLHRLVGSLKLVAAKTASDTTGVKTKPAPQPPMEYQHVGDVFLEIFCNPNIWATPFAAKVLITLRDDRIRLTTEAELSRLLEDVDRYLESVEGSES